MSYYNSFSLSPFADLPPEESVLKPDYKHLAAHLSKKEKLDIITEKNLPNLEPSVKTCIDGLQKIKRCKTVNAAGEVEGLNNASSLNREAAKAVPYFWLIVLKNIQQFELSYRDEQALRYLKDITSTKVDKNDFKLEFFFDPNPYFKNSVLAKTYYMYDKEDKKEVCGQAIDWRPGQCLTEMIMSRQHFVGHEGMKPIFETQSCLSFFDFFSPVSEPISENDAKAIDNLMEGEFDIGVYIRDKVIPKALSWFTGDVKEDDFLESDAETDHYGSDVSYTSSSESEDGDTMSEDEEVTSWNPKEGA